MLNQDIQDQLRQLFAPLGANYQFVLQHSEHEKQPDMRQLLAAVAETSPRLSVVEREPRIEGIRLELQRDGKPTGVVFRGVPGGHELSSLVLAIVNADGKGRLPDEATLKRANQLRGGVELRTYVSLSCTNCPDVVQALNLVALNNPGIRHTMIDGGLVPQEIEALGIRAVPAVFADDELVHVGKSSFAELLETLEEQLGSVRTQASHAAKAYDTIVVGGGPAGASAAIYSARKGLRTALVAGQLGGQVKETLGIENLIGTRYTEGSKLVAELEGHLAAYPIDVLDNRRVERLESASPKRLHLKGGELLEAPSVVVATGARWRQLGIPGEKEFMGRGVAYCPHCDGPFYRGKAVAVVGGGNSGVEAAIDLAGICEQVTLFEFLETLQADDVLVKRVHSLPNVRVIAGAKATEILGGDEGVTAMRYEDRQTAEAHEVALDGVFVQIGLVPNSAWARDVLDTNAAGEIVVDAGGRTSAPGIYAAGDVTSVPFKQIVVAMGEGAKAALSLFEDRMRA